jgi:hypothetical protein
MINQKYRFPGHDYPVSMEVRYGKNKDHEHPPQINLNLLFGQQSPLSG